MPDITFFCLFTGTTEEKVGVVLSGGGYEVAHIKALKVVKTGIPIDYIVGTSMGSIVGGLAIGYTPEQLDSMVRKQDWTFLLSDRIKRSACRSPNANALQNTLFRFLSQRTRKLPCPEELSKDRILPFCSLI